MVAWVYVLGQIIMELGVHGRESSSSPDRQEGKQDRWEGQYKIQSCEHTPSEHSSSYVPLEQPAKAFSVLLWSIFFSRHTELLPGIWLLDLWTWSFLYLENNSPHLVCIFQSRPNSHLTVEASLNKVAMSHLGFVIFFRTCKYWTYRHHWYPVMALSVSPLLKWKLHREETIFKCRVPGYGMIPFYWEFHSCI